MVVRRHIQRDRRRDSRVLDHYSLGQLCLTRVAVVDPDAVSSGSPFSPEISLGNSEAML
jgi:hypothetical protein